jgi:hypothetical protein
VPKPKEPKNDNPCVLPPGGGYRGLENHLYRVQIVTGGLAGTAEYAWSRDNASVAARVTAISNKEITIELPGRQASECFKEALVEVTSDALELSGRPGALRKIDKVSDNVLTLDAALPAGFETDAGPVIARIRRWEGSGTVPDPVADVELEDGISMRLSLAVAKGRFRTGE